MAAFEHGLSLSLHDRNDSSKSRSRSDCVWCRQRGTPRSVLNSLAHASWREIRNKYVDGVKLFRRRDCKYLLSMDISFEDTCSGIERRLLLHKRDLEDIGGDQWLGYDAEQTQPTGHWILLLCTYFHLSVLRIPGHLYDDELFAELLSSVFAASYNESDPTGLYSGVHGMDIKKDFASLQRRFPCLQYDECMLRDHKPDNVPIGVKCSLKTWMRGCGFGSPEAHRDALPRRERKGDYRIYHRMETPFKWWESIKPSTKTSSVGAYCIADALWSYIMAFFPLHLLPDHLPRMEYGPEKERGWAYSPLPSRSESVK